jgi:hypothetical protein
MGISFVFIWLKEYTLDRRHEHSIMILQHHEIFPNKQDNVNLNMGFLQVTFYNSFRVVNILLLNRLAGNI